MASTNSEVGRAVRCLGTALGWTYRFFQGGKLESLVDHSRLHRFGSHRCTGLARLGGVAALALASCSRAGRRLLVPFARIAAFAPFARIRVLGATCRLASLARVQRALTRFAAHERLGLQRVAREHIVQFIQVRHLLSRASRPPFPTHKPNHIDWLQLGAFLLRLGLKGIGERLSARDAFDHPDEARVAVLPRLPGRAFTCHCLNVTAVRQRGAQL